MKRQKGFTLIELLVVIGIIAILAAIVAIAVNPSRQYGQARDAQRWSDINAILNGLHQYAADNQGNFPPLTGTLTNIGAATLNGSATGYIDICSYLVDDYLPAMPVDPSDSTTYYYNDCTDYNTGYSISYSGSRVTIRATHTEEAASPIELIK